MRSLDPALDLPCEGAEPDLRPGDGSASGAPPPGQWEEPRLDGPSGAGSRSGLGPGEEVRQGLRRVLLLGLILILSLCAAIAVLVLLLFGG